MTTSMRLYGVRAGRRAQHSRTPVPDKVATRLGSGAPSTRHEHPDSRLIAFGGEPWLWGLVAALFDDPVDGRVPEMIRFPRDTDAGVHGYIRDEARISLAF